MLASPASEPKHAWCVDFLRDGHEFGIDGVEGCCDKDERLFLGWCNQEGAADHPLYKEACEVHLHLASKKMETKVKSPLCFFFYLFYQIITLLSFE